MTDSIAMPSPTPEMAKPVTLEDWWSLTAIVGWMLFPDPAVNKALCKPLRLQHRNRLDPDTGGRILFRRKTLRTLAQKALETTASTTVRPMRREKILAAAERQVPEDQNLVAVFPSHLRTRKRALQQVPEDEKIHEIVEAKVRELWGALGEGTLTAEGTDPVTRRRGRIPREEFSMPPTLGDIFESRVGEYRNVVVHCDDVLRRWRSTARDGKGGRSAVELKRARGRPRLPRGKTAAEQQAAYFEAHGFDATVEHFGVKEATLEKNLRRAADRSGQ